ncbi:hypothetical protein J0X19_03420 [Hymenobacter sp. BT186]|uniref:KAP NTPase domain-containing protein n=1 Tax=Hymenobacter telluris TaxID=2816474 RepID=A0A939JBP1_9BACT|nr:P-loop NTPase fold protein [Hymenobacter telluris]MBO0356983.1 hypothetical protein [Hymenobacter telluris]MBW3373010.1 KAP family NTPase [Hymenobacter norwichensis]
MYLRIPYSSNTAIKNRFFSLLGIQAEVQKEIRALVKAWLKGNNEKILLIVDDIDRCNEDKIIQIIDSLRIMLEDNEISNKMVVLTAIDERLLKLAVKRKYFDFIDKDLSLKNKQIEAEKLSNKMVREYLDKLFIAGIKLGRLSLGDKIELFKAFTRGQVDTIKDTSQKTDNVQTTASVTKPIYHESQSINVDLYEQEEIEISQNSSKPFALSAKEFEFISNIIGNLDTEITPRQIRIYYYRYLLARNLLFKKYLNFSSQLQIEQVRHLLAGMLILKCFELDGIQETNKVSTNNNLHTITILGIQYKMNRDLIMEISSVVEMVVGY